MAKKIAKKKVIQPDKTSAMNTVRADLLHHYFQGQNKNDISAFRTFGKSRNAKGKGK